MTYLLPLVFLFCSCGGGKDPRLAEADRVMEEHPDSALAILEAIDSASLKGEDNRALHALLLTQALDKNYIDKTDFDVLQPALDYYPQIDNPDLKLRTFYYQGRIYQNRGEDGLAMNSFINALDLIGVKDSLSLARTLLAQGTLYHKLYKAEEFTALSRQAAKLFLKTGKTASAARSYAKALNGATILGNKVLADSILSECEQLMQSYPQYKIELIPSILAYKREMRPQSELQEILEDLEKVLKDSIVNESVILEMAKGYNELGYGEKSISWLERINSPSDSLQYFLTKSMAYEKAGDFPEALELFHYYQQNLEFLHDNLFNKGLLFAEERHNFEMSMLQTENRKNQILWISISGALLLLTLIILFICLYRITCAKRKITEKENESLKLEKENQIAQNEILAMKKHELEVERDNLLTTIENNPGTTQFNEVLIKRVEILNGLLASELTSNKSHEKGYWEWVRTIKKDKAKFIESIKESLRAANPSFVSYLDECDLSEEETYYICLYALGLNGKEIGNYVQTKSHYNLSSNLRKKLGMDSEKSTLGAYIRKKIQEP